MRILVLIVCLHSLVAVADSPSLPPVTEVSQEEAEALGFEIYLTRDLSSLDCLFSIRVSAPESIGELGIRSVAIGLMKGNELLFAPSGSADGSEQHTLVSGKMLRQLVIVAGYIGDGMGTVYRIRFSDTDGRCK